MLAVLAFSLNLSDRVKTYGAYAGFASIIGLAVLAILYFAQAREVKRLREWAGRGPERAAEVAARVTAEPQKRVVATPLATPTTPAAQTPAGAPPAPTPPADASAAGTELPAADSAPPTTPGAPIVPSTSPPASAAAISGMTQAIPPISTSARTRHASGLDAGDDDERSPMRSRLIIGGVVAAIAIVAVALAVSLGGGSDKKAPNKIVATATTTTTSTTTTPQTTTTPKKKKKTKTTTGPTHSSISVIVMNGTTIPGLAARTSQKLKAAAYDVDPARPHDAPTQNYTATVVYYIAGQPTAGAAVAKSLGLAADATQILNPDIAVAAGGEHTVVVVTGQDIGKTP